LPDHYEFNVHFVFSSSFTDKQAEVFAQWRNQKQQSLQR
jgi:hypothetical protein